MKICLFTPSFLPEIGGMEIVIDRLARQFRDMGHEPVVIAQAPRHNGQTVELPYEVVYYVRPRSTVWLLGSVKRLLLEEQRRHGFDIIHAHMAYPTGYVACALKRRLGVPVVITSHKGDIVPESRYRQRRIPRRRMQWALEAADAATGVSSGLKDIIDELTEHKAKSLVIPNGVDMPADTPGSMPKHLTGLCPRNFMLTLGRLHSHKGIDVLIDSIRRLRDLGIAVPRLVVAGDGRERESLRSRASESGLEDEVVFCGPVYGEEKHWLLRNCAFFVQPSRVEGMPLTVLEAMAYGKVVVGTRISGIVELIQANENGFLAEPDDSVSLANTLLSVLTSKDLGRIEANARTLASRMTWREIARMYLELYQRLSAQVVLAKE